MNAVRVAHVVLWMQGRYEEYWRGL